MTYDQFNTYCGSLTHATYVEQWGGSQVWKVGGKVFAIGGRGPSKEPGYTFKTSDLDFDLLKEQEGFRPAPHLASRGMKWIQQFGFTTSSEDELKYYLAESYRIVSLGLTKKAQQELGLNQGSRSEV